MVQLNRRTFILTTAAAASTRALPPVVRAGKSRRILTLVYDKSLGMMRAIDRLVP